MVVRLPRFKKIFDEFRKHVTHEVYPFEGDDKNCFTIEKRGGKYKVISLEGSMDLDPHRARELAQALKYAAAVAEAQDSEGAGDDNSGNS